MKPYSDEALKKAIDKYLKLFRGESKGSALNATMIDELKSALMSSQKEYKKRFTIKKTSGIFLLKTEAISYFTASDDLVFAMDEKNKRHIVNYRMSDLEDILDPKVFFRINRSEIVNINFIQKMEPYFGNRLVISIKNGKDSLKTSGPKTTAFRKWVEGIR